MKCFNESTKLEVRPGDAIYDFRGERHIVKDVCAPGTSGGGNGGRIYTDKGGRFPSVFNCVFAEEKQP